MPSPRTSDTNGAGHHGDGGMDLRTAVAEIPLLPTPAVNDMGAAYTPDEWDAWTAKMKAAHGNGNGRGKSLHIEAARLLPTPTRRDHKDGQIRREPHRPDDVDTLARALTDVLLPTPRATDGSKGGPNQRGSSGDLMLPSAVSSLLPTPTAKDAAQSGGSTPTDVTLTDAVVRTQLGSKENPRHAVSTEGRPREELRSVWNSTDSEEVCEREAGGSQRLPEAPSLLTELREQQGVRAGEHSPMEGSTGQGADRLRGMRGDGRDSACASRRQGCDEQQSGEPSGDVPVVPSPTALAGGSIRPDGVDFGAYTHAIERWEAVLGRPAPAPTKLNSKGNAKLSDEFDEFLMGFPKGWITDVPGVTWNEALKACGNGVVPQQGAAAVRRLVLMGSAQ